MNTVGEMNGGSSFLGSNAVVDAVEGILVLMDIIATGTQLEREMKRKAASNEMFMFLSSQPALADNVGKGEIFSSSERILISDEQLEY